MKIRKTYVLFVNEMTKMAFYGGSEFNKRISRATLGNIIDCTFSELKSNIFKLKSGGFTIQSSKF